jgi:plastocyanin
MSARRICLLALVCGLIAPAGAAGRTVTFRLGPIALGSYQSRISTEHVPTPRLTGSITSMHARVVDLRGHFVPQHIVMLHHVTFVNDGVHLGDKGQEYCGRHQDERFYGTGEEDESMVLPPGYGYHVRRGDRWHASWMLMNHRFEPRRVYIEYTVRITPGWHDIGVTPYWLGVAPCPKDPIFEVPGGGAPGSDYVKSIVWKPPADGRIVAVGTHLHGGAKSMDILEPACGNRALVTTGSEYGPASDPIYHVLPQIHEPGPRFVSYPLSPTGIPVHRGSSLTVRGVYDGELPHSRVMAIMHAYVAPAPKGVGPPCGPLPTDVHYLHWDQPYRTEVPQVFIPLTIRDATGRAQAIDDLPGPVYSPRGTPTVAISNTMFNHQKVEIPTGGSIRYVFRDRTLHDVTTANGPTAIGSQYMSRGRVYTQRFTRPGTYQLYCTLHPVDMHQVVVVK